MVCFTLVCPPAYSLLQLQALTLGQIREHSYCNTPVHNQKISGYNWTKPRLKLPIWKAAEVLLDKTLSILVCAELSLDSLQCSEAVQHGSRRQRRKLLRDLYRSHWDCR